MKYLPFEHIIYTTNLSEQEVITRLSDLIEAKRIRFVFNNKSTKDYEGFINDNSFEINRIIKGRNSFLPQISGSLQKINDETQIEVKMRLHGLVIIFLIFWCLFIIFALITIFTSVKEISLDSFIPVLMLIIAYIFTMYGFKSESKKSKEYLKKIFEARMIA